MGYSQRPLCRISPRLINVALFIIKESITLELIQKGKGWYSAMTKRCNAILMLLLYAFITVTWVSTGWGAEKRVTRGSYLAAATEEMLDRAVQYTNDGDMKALQKLLDAGLVIYLRSGITVFIVQVKISNGTVKIRPEGSTDEIWTAIEAVLTD